VIRYFQKIALGVSESFELEHARTKQKFVFEGMVGRETLYEKIMAKDREVGQRKVVVRGNYVNGTEKVTYKCLGVAVFGNEDVN